jgi:NTP pyrophosphatase (non-canonical NTP hydrolase)
MTHQELVSKLVKDGDTIVSELTGKDAHLWHMATGVAGEGGELLDAVKKAVIYRKPLDRKNVVEEIGDLEFFLEGMRQALDITREECLQENIKKLSLRYEKLTYSDRSAQERKDKDIEKQLEFAFVSEE